MPTWKRTPSQARQFSFTKGFDDTCEPRSSRPTRAASSMAPPCTVACELIWVGRVLEATGSADLAAPEQLGKEEKQKLHSPALEFSALLEF